MGAPIDCYFVIFESWPCLPVTCKVRPTNTSKSVLTSSYRSPEEVMEVVDLVQQRRPLHATVSYFRQRRPLLSLALQQRSVCSVDHQPNYVLRFVMDLVRR